MDHLTAVVKKGRKHFVALCLELGVSSQGETQDEALANLRDAAETLVEYLQDSGREEELAERRVTPEHLGRFLYGSRSGTPDYASLFESSYRVGKAYFERPRTQGARGALPHLDVVPVG
ncbi:MAG: hypothetical protein COZ06_15020 [Armatimonadetes bacterium CG_4_10_14_3_um_filter_66_18]|nr:MAG: hypothetical protein COZ57_23450 [Armatimonadetes bacterium CG_4_8_14_3_um_filter_66_20]PIY49047.1 MAG: hypothetical protein COZ06_15020 [Armatimonadetes bacterium CG_4_10_14_3_um_filter_66_18]